MVYLSRWSRTDTNLCRRRCLGWSFCSMSTLYGITYGDGLFVAVGANGTIGTSTNGTNWVAQNSGTTTVLLGVTYENGLFVAVGGAATIILTSTNGTNWTSVNPGTRVYGLRGIASGNNKFVAVGGYAPAAAGGSITISPNGTTWNAQNSGINTANFYGIAWGNGSFVTVGGGGGIGNIILSSTDATTWINRFAGTSPSLNGAVYGNGSFVAVGHVGTILQSGPIFTLAGKNQFANSGFELDLTGEIGRSYRLQASTDLTDTNWTDLINFTNTIETTQFLDTCATNFSERYYRAVSP